MISNPWCIWQTLKCQFKFNIVRPNVSCTTFKLLSKSALINLFTVERTCTLSLDSPGSEMNSNWGSTDKSSTMIHHSPPSIIPSARSVIVITGTLHLYVALAIYGPYFPPLHPASPLWQILSEHDILRFQVKKFHMKTKTICKRWRSFRGANIWVLKKSVMAAASLSGTVTVAYHLRRSDSKALNWLLVNNSTSRTQSNGVAQSFESISGVVLSWWYSGSSPYVISSATSIMLWDGFLDKISKMQKSWTRCPCSEDKFMSVKQYFWTSWHWRRSMGL